MEHIWVEAAIDYLPSRGAVNRSADSWLPLDASYKQYEFMEGLDVAQIANLDGEALANNFLQSGAVNEQEGWVQNLDAAILQNAQQEAQQKLEAHIAQLTDPTVGEVIGGRKVILRELPILPYQKVVEGARYGELPAKLRPTITFGLGADILGDSVHQKTLPWSALNNRKVTLSFNPATADDEAALKALLPEGEITDLSQLPKSIPAYLIQVIPEVKVEGDTVLASTAIRLGEDLAFSYSVTDPTFGTQRYPNEVVAGSFLAIAIAVIGGSVAVGSLEEVKAKLDTTREKLPFEAPSSGRPVRPLGRIDLSAARG
jgi:hypothetical protein